MREQCIIADCDRPQKCRGWCAKHYPTHQRVKRLRGRAADHQCTHCQSAADQWAYDNEDPNEIRNAKGQRYSLDPARYLPLCTPCHAKFDAEYRERNGIRNRYPQRRCSPCGTRAAYNRGCRCDACRAAQSAYTAARKAVA